MEFLKLNIQFFGASNEATETGSSKSGGNTGTLYTKFTETSTNTTNNTSSITAYCKFTQNTGSFAAYYTPKLQLWWYDNNENKSGKRLTTDSEEATTQLNYGGTGKTKEFTKTLTVKHLEDGTLNGYVVAKWIWTGGGYACSSFNAQTDSTPLTAIPRENTLGTIPSEAYLGDSVVIPLNKKSAIYRTQVTVELTGNGVTKSNTKTVAKDGTSATIELTKSIFESAFSSNTSSIKAKVTAITINDSGTQIGSTSSNSTTLSVKLKEADYEPVVSISAVDSNTTTKTLTGDTTGRTCVLNASTMTCTVSAAAQNNATLSSVTINGVSVATTTKTYTINNPTTNTFTIVAKDSRGFSNEANDTLPNPVSYFKPTVTASFKRNTPTDGKVNLTYSGKIFNKSFGAKSNELSFYYEYKLKSASSYTSVELKPTISGDTFSGSLTLPETYDYQQNYSFRLRVVDSLNTIVYAQDVAKGEPVLWWNEDSVNVNGSLTQINKPVPFVKKSKNLFNKDYVVSGYRIASDGANYAESGYFASNFIPIEPNTYYYVSHKDNGAMTRVAFYNADRTFISGDINNNVAVLSPSNARYLRFGNLLTKLDLIQVEVGKEGTTYESYIEPKVYINRGGGDEIFPFSIAERLNNVDVNMLVDKFTVAYGSNLLNTPQNYGQIISIPVMNNKEYARQFFISNEYEKMLYTRCKVAGSWQGWRAFSFYNDRNIMTIKLSANTNITCSATWTNYNIPLNALKYNTGSKLTFTSNGIKIGSGVSKVMVSANSMLMGVVGYQYIGIYKNSETCSSGYYRATANNFYGTIGLSPMLINVAEGDLITLKLGVGATGTITVAGDVFTYLTVEVVE